MSDPQPTTIKYYTVVAFPGDGQPELKMVAAGYTYSQYNKRMRAFFSPGQARAYRTRISRPQRYDKYVPPEGVEWRILVTQIAHDGDVETWWLD